ncbi:glycosyltransferase [Arthrobacter sp. zg-Y179]|uniref:glycosyltransferase n=1 Tax=Arthrobacter sp. zg-Y179 TaxID=2894188 RepID=UPI001E4F572B|nr:glycosyltransferase [Arthrobacter sp. zg-Y179]MCC9174280.1 glycosyltransferase [Arthrobacter sp. zg-Y179]
MTYADEQLSFSPAESLRRQRYATDVDALIADYERVTAQGKQDARELESLRGEFQSLLRESVRLRAELQSSKAEAVRLRSTLTALRASSSLRAGKAVMLPARGLRKSVREIRRIRDAVLSQDGSAASTATSTHTSSTATKSRPQLRALQQTYLAKAQEDPTAANIIRAVSHAYFVLGDVKEPAALIRQHQPVLDNPSAKDQRTIDAVLGMDRLMERLPPLAARQPNPGYLVERGRIMYCAHSTGHFNSNGYSSRTAELSQGLLRGGMDVLVAARPGYPWDVATDHPPHGFDRFTQKIRGVEHVFNPGPSWTQQSLDHYWFEATDVYVREAQRARVEAIHAASNHVTALPALAAARRLGVPFSYEVRGLWEVTEASGKPSWEQSDRYQLAEKLETFVALHADTVFAITEQVKDELIRRGVAPEKIHLLPNGVDTDRFAPMPPSARLRDKLRLPADIPVVGYAGSLIHYEGISDLLSALAILKDNGKQFRAVIVGDGAELGQLRRQTGALGLEDRVQFTGRVDAEDIPDYVSIFDVMPCPRLRLPVTELVSPLKPLEAMAAGKAMVLTDLGPLRTFAGEDQERALLAQPSDPESLARALGALLDDPQQRRDLGRRARLWAVSHRKWDVIGAETARELNAVIAEAQISAPTGKTLKQITVGVIADTFTTEGLRPEVAVSELHPDNWRAQIQDRPLDVLFVESAWEGTGGHWRQKVGYYDDERFRPLRELVEYCRQQSIPTIFWNKEDPVHFNRFRRTAEIFDHVFTTDANCLRQYARSDGTHNRTISSLPFYAQPQLHNPLPTERPYSHTVAYAGSYYGERYPQRSAELTALLDAARPLGLTIYDRQHLNPESPYRFPGALQPFVQGGLPYLEMVSAYKSHPVHVNVNSVDASPTMFSRRVVELAASGTAVVSGNGQGVDRVLGGLIHTVAGRDETKVLLDRWMNDEGARLDDVWLAYRLVHRGHTAAHRLAYALRCAGLVITAPQPPGYAVKAQSVSPAFLKSLETQTVRPAAVIVAGDPSGLRTDLTCVREEDATPEVLSRLGVSWLATVPDMVPDRTVFEDLLTAVSFGDWAEIGVAQEEPVNRPGGGLATVGPSRAAGTRLVPLHSKSAGKQAVSFRRRGMAGNRTADTAAPNPARRPQSVLVAGHDLKFAAGIIGALEAAGHTVAIDRWQDHNRHNEEQSRSLLAAADTVFCEWTLGNAAWYSKNVRPDQRLVTRMHSQELFTRYPGEVDQGSVQSMIFVGRHVADLAIRDHGIPAEKVRVIPNPVDTLALGLQKSDEARFRLGLVGIVPAQKHLDRALDLLSILRKQDTRYQLHIKGKRPEDYPWMANRADEMAYYREQESRISTDPTLQGAVHFDGHGNDMPQWYQTVGIVLSLSDFESFHLTLADGAASGSVPVTLPWAGADQIYPVSWIQPGLSEMADYISGVTSSAEKWRSAGAGARSFAVKQFAQTKILPEILDVILGTA